MKEKKTLLILGTIVLISAFVISLIFIFNHHSPKKIDKSKSAQIYLEDLGDSEVTIIKKNNNVILINTGLEKDLDNLLDYFDQLEIKKITYLILTDKSDKYIGNLPFILRNYNVDYLYWNDYAYTSEKIEEVNNILLDNYVDPIVLTGIENIKLDTFNIDIYPYMEEEATMEDKTFIVKLYDGDKNIYLTSNASDSRLEEVVDSYLLVSENSNIYSIKSKYYIYDGKESITNKKNLWKRKTTIFMNSEDFVVE